MFRSTHVVTFGLWICEVRHAGPPYACQVWYVHKKPTSCSSSSYVCAFKRKKKKERNREYINIYTHIYILKLAFQTKIFLPSDQHTLKYLYLCLPPTEELGEIKTRNNVKTIRCSEKAKHSLWKEVEKVSHSTLAITLLIFIKCLCCAKHCFNPCNPYNDLAYPANFIDSLI